MNARLKILFIFLVLAIAGTGVTVLIQSSRASAINLSQEPAPLISIEKHVSPVSQVKVHDPVTYDIVLSNSGVVSDSLVLLTDTLPVEVDFGDWILQPAGASAENDTITWSGAISAGHSITFTFNALHIGEAGDVVTNTAAFSGTMQAGNASAAFTVQPGLVFLPSVANAYCADFYDDFSDPTSGWWVGEDENYRSGYLSGEYQVLGKAAGWWYAFGAPNCGLENYSVEADAHWNGNPGLFYGLVFGIAGDYEQFYAFMVNTDYYEGGYPYELFRYDPQGWTELTYGFSNAIYGGPAKNHLKVTRAGNSITLVANGTTLLSWTDSTITGVTYTGLILITYEDLANADARFDNFRITQVAPIAGTTVTSHNRQVAPAPPRRDAVFEDWVSDDLHYSRRTTDD